MLHAILNPNGNKTYIYKGTLEEYLLSAELELDQITVLDVPTEQAELDAKDSALDSIRVIKGALSTAVRDIVVTVDNMVFDGDEISQGRMARAVTASSPGDTSQWKLNDNTVATVTHEQLRAALKLAGDAQTALWMV